MGGHYEEYPFSGFSNPEKDSIDALQSKSKKNNHSCSQQFNTIAVHPDFSSLLVIRRWWMALGQ
jgi:hypothetical protein